jgi:adenosine kinase
MKIGVAGSIGRDHLMTFPGDFTDSLVEGSLAKVSLSFLVDTLDIRRGGVAGNIAFGMGVLGLDPILIAAVGKDWADYDAWLTRHGVNTSHAKVSKTLHTASFMVTTDRSLNQIASFFPGAMSEAREIEIGPIADAVGGLDLLVISPDDPEAMLRHSQAARDLGIPFAADPSQQLARMEGEEVKNLIRGAKYLLMNEYELALTLQKTGWSDRELFDQVEIRVITLGSHGARVEEHGKATIKINCAVERSKTDPTGVGDAFRSGFLAGISWGFDHERSAQLGAMLATYCLETIGTQEYRFDEADFMARFTESFGSDAAAEIATKIKPRVVG